MAQSQDEPVGPNLADGIPLSQLEDNQPLQGHVGDDSVVVVKQGTNFFAIGAHCTHYGGPLADGLISGETIRCPWHHAAFSLRTGQAVSAPAFASAGCYPVEVENGSLKVLPKTETSDQAPPRDKPTSIVMIGAGAAAAAAAETLRQEGYQGPITMIGHESMGPIDRPNLSKDYLAGEAQEDWIPLGGDAHWNDLDVKVLKSTTVESIDRDNQNLLLSDGRTLRYHTLIYATGAEPVRPPIDGLSSTRAFTLRSFEDSEAISNAAETGKRALIIGASFIGLETAASLRKRGLHVDVVALDEVPLAHAFGPELGAFVQSLHEAQGVRFHLQQTVEKFDGKTAHLKNGATLEFDFVVLGTGVRPRQELAESAGLNVDNGVVVNDALQTSDPSIYAVGDVANFPNPVGSGRARIEHWVLAQQLAQRAARNILGVTHPRQVDIPFFWSRHYDTSISYVGFAPAFDEVLSTGNLQEGQATFGYVLDDKIVAVATVGRDIDSLRSEEALASGDQKTLRKIFSA